MPFVILDGTALNCERVAVSVSTSGDNDILPAVPGKQYNVIAIDLTTASAVTVTTETPTSPGQAIQTNLNGRGVVKSGDCAGNAYIFQPTVGEKLVVNLSGNVAVAGSLYYALV